MTDDEHTGPPEDVPQLPPPPSEELSIIVESGGRVEVIGGDAGPMGELSTVEHLPAGQEAAESDDDAKTPFSADLSLDTPKSYMSATGDYLLPWDRGFGLFVAVMVLAGWL